MELDIFSGRPNPRWELDETATDALRRLLRRLPVAAVRPAKPPGLGYRGFAFVDAGREFRAYDGYVTGPGVVLADPDRSIEHLLLAQLPGELDEVRASIDLQAGE